MQSRNHRETLDKAGRDAFLQALTELGDIDLACARVGVSRQAAYNTRYGNRTFRDDWMQILERWFSSGRARSGRRIGAKR